MRELCPFLHLFLQASGAWFIWFSSPDRLTLFSNNPPWPRGYLRTASWRGTRLTGMESDALVGLGCLGWAVLIYSIPDIPLFHGHPFARLVFLKIVLVTGALMSNSNDWWQCLIECREEFYINDLPPYILYLFNI